MVTTAAVGGAAEGVEGRLGRAAGALLGANVVDEMVGGCWVVLAVVLVVVESVVVLVGLVVVVEAVVTAAATDGAVPAGGSCPTGTHRAKARVMKM